MISLEGFANKCAKAIQDGWDFIAYRHSHGTGLLRLNTVEYKDKEGKERRITANAKEKNHFRRNIEKMRKDLTCGVVYVVECHGGSFSSTDERLHTLIEEALR